MPTVVFLHGLNTFDDGLVHIGPLTFGEMNASWKRELVDRGYEFIDVSGMGFGPVDEQADRALEYLKSSGVLASGKDLHFLGQSMGGLVARALAHRAPLKGRVKSIITIATPHEGADITHRTMNLRKLAPKFYALFRLFGYDFESQNETYSHFTPDRLKEVTSRYPLIDDTRCVSLVGSVPFSELSWPFQLIYPIVHPREEKVESDGFLFASTQRWGNETEVFKLDHLGQIGIFLQIRRKHRLAARREFKRLVEKVVSIIERRDSK